ncbi:MAG: phosphoenolpyruvate--protein phosphotransferase [Oligoflexia bacterium]|nr:phosphoenolpyruvate--protein phosphotransferase [Oligoflexia bacterium]
MNASKVFTGSVVSFGLVAAKALVVKSLELKISKESIAPSQVSTEVARLESAISSSVLELQEVRSHANAKMGAESAAIFEAHLLMLNDPELFEKTKEVIATQLVNTEFAFHQVSEEFIALFSSMDDEYMRERALDVRDISRRVLRHLLGVQEANLAHLPEEVILVAYDLTPSQTAVMDKNKVVGMVTEVGGKTSHTAIMANSLGIAALVGVNKITAEIQSGDQLAINGETGELYLHPDPEQLSDLMKRKDAYLQKRKILESLKGVPSTTPDGQQVHLLANIASDEELKFVLASDAEGIGLFRTEFLYMNRTSLPSEEEQFLVYRKVLQEIQGRPVTIRTIDIGGDKEIDYLNLPKELNPFLGVRAIRLCFKRPELFKTQLRALLRASVYGHLKIMFPMISSLEELLAAKAVVDEVKNALQSEGIPFAPNLPLGIMIEVPSAAIISDVLAQHVDFFSIGTNDLIQYTLAVDRLNQELQSLYSPFNLACLRLIELTIKNGKQHGIEVGMCGSVAGSEEMIPLLLGMGLDEFSMSARQILPARKVVTSTTKAFALEIAAKVLSMHSGQEIENYLRANSSLKMS